MIWTSRLCLRQAWRAVSSIGRRKMRSPESPSRPESQSWSSPGDSGNIPNARKKLKHRWTSCGARAARWSIEAWQKDRHPPPSYSSTPPPSPLDANSASCALVFPKSDPHTSSPEHSTLPADGFRTLARFRAAPGESGWV